MSIIFPTHLFKKLTVLLVIFFGWLNQRVSVLSTPVLRDIFLAMYFSYKKHIEDPFYGLTSRRPDLFQNGHIFDIGSNVGFTVSLFTSVVSAGYQVHAFEPEPKNLNLLNNVIRKKGISSKVCVNRIAVGNRCGEIQLIVNQRHHADHRVLNSDSQLKNISNNLISVPIITIDNYWKSLPEPRKVAFVKMDVQGFEPAVLEGMQELLRSQEDVIVALEFAPEAFRDLGFSSEAIYSIINTWNNRAIFAIAKNGQIHRIDKYDISNYSETINLLLAPKTLLI